MNKRPALRNWSAAAALVAGGFFLMVVAVVAGVLVACESRAESPKSRIDRGLDHAATYLQSKQSADGAWRSETYGALADGMSLTPFVLKTLLLGPPSTESQSACDRAAAYVRDQVAPDGSILPQPALGYPVYTAALAAIVLNRRLIDGSASDSDRRAQDAWLEYLRDFQLNDRLGWSPTDVAYGGWGYSVRPPRKPETSRLPFEADLSSTLFAVGALRLAGVPPDDQAIRDALTFVKRCQNFSDDVSRHDPVHDDGGFFFTPANRVQNKAGVAGTDVNGVLRYHSYGSATADGMRALVRCGLVPDHPRVLAARAWIERNFSTQTNPGVFEPALAADRDAAWHYWCWSVSHALRLLDVSTIVREGNEIRWARLLADELVQRQLPNGSWRNSYSFMKEDDPLIATTLAAAALANCRAAMWPQP